MSAVIQFPSRRPAVFGLAIPSSEHQESRGRRAVVQLGGVATVCVVAEIPRVGDVIHANVTGVVENVRVTRDGLIRVHARALASNADAVEDPTTSGRSPRVAAVLAEMRRRRLRNDNRSDRAGDLPAGA